MVENNNYKISDKIRFQRKVKGLSQEELAFKLSVARQTISRWESGVSIPDSHNIKSMCELFDVNNDYFFEYKGIIARKELSATVIDITPEYGVEPIESKEIEKKVRKKVPAHRMFIYVFSGLVLATLFTISLIMLISILAAPRDENTVVSTSFQFTPEFICGAICSIIAIFVVVFLLYKYFKSKK